MTAAGSRIAGWGTRIASFRMGRRTRVALTALLGLVAAVATVAAAAGAADAAPPVDYGVFAGPGADILRGHWSAVFTDPGVQAGPFELIFWGVPQLLGVGDPVGWTVVYAVQSALITAALAVVAYRVARPVSPDTAAPIAAAVAAFAAVSQIVLRTVTIGHPAESVIPLLWVVAALLARRDRVVAAAAVVGLAAGWETWGLLGAPVVLLVPRIRANTFLRGLAGGVAALAVTFGGFALAGPVAMFGYRWLVQDGTLVHLLLPDEETFGWPLRVAQGAIALAVGVAAALAMRGRRDAIWLVPLAVFSVRLLTDPLLAGYYLSAAAVLTLLGLSLALAERSLVRLIAVVLLLDLATGILGRGWPALAAMVAVTATTIVVLVRLRAPAAAADGPQPLARASME